MHVNLSLSPEAEKQLRESAAQSGQTVEAFIQQLVEREVSAANGVPRSPVEAEPLDAVLAPIREEFERSGMSDDDLAALVEDVRDKIWREKQARKVS